MRDFRRTVTGLDHGSAKGTFIHAGLIFRGHLAIDRLHQATKRLMEIYPELSVAIELKMPSVIFPKFYVPRTATTNLFTIWVGPQSQLNRLRLAPGEEMTSGFELGWLGVPESPAATKSVS